MFASPAIRLDGELAEQDLMPQHASDLQNQTIDNGKNTASAEDALNKKLAPRIRKNTVEYLVLISYSSQPDLLSQTIEVLLRGIICGR